MKNLICLFLLFSHAAYAENSAFSAELPPGYVAFKAQESQKQYSNLLDSLNTRIAQENADWIFGKRNNFPSQSTNIFERAFSPSPPVIIVIPGDAARAAPFSLGLTNK